MFNHAALFHSVSYFSLRLLVASTAVVAVLATSAVSANAAESCEAICASIREEGLAQSKDGAATYCCCLTDAEGVVVSQSLEACQVPISE